MEDFRHVGLPQPTENIALGQQNLDNFGLTIHQNFLSDEALRALRDRLTEQAELECESSVAAFAFDESDRNIVDNYWQPYIGKPVGLPRLQRIHFLANKGRVFIELAKHPAALAYAQHVFRGEPYNVGVQLGLILRKGAPAQPIHTDQPHVPFTTPFPLSLNVVVALSEYDESNGSTRFIPGTHQGPPPARGLDPSKAGSIAVTVQPGSAVIWDSRLWHAQGECLSDKSRCSITTMYAVNFLKPPDYHPAIIHDDVYETMSEGERVLYDFKYNGGGHIAPRHPGDPRKNVGSFMPYVPELSRSQGKRCP